ncbi:hypothetical protein [Bacteroides sp.]|uniref:hypothetical protein n=1 Tax=Bacteroides sp. TaxID=29523 RepID=UPI0025BF6130|nr:hypothetical protein [Bacteroides sp.]
MKKLVFLFVAFVAVSFASCGGNKNANAEATEAAAVVEEATPACDSVKACCDSVACDSAKACCDKAE